MLKIVFRLLIIFIGLVGVGPSIAQGASNAASDNEITSWQIRWERASEKTASPEQAAGAGEWQTIHMQHPLITKPDETVSAWVKFKLPKLNNNEGLFFPLVYGQTVTVYKSGQVLFHSERKYWFDINRVLIPLSEQDSGKEIYFQLQSDTDRLGLGAGMEIGDYQNLVRSYSKYDILDIIIGSAFIFVALVMLVCSVFLVRNQLKSWISLCFIILPIGGILIGYSPFLYTFYGQYGYIYLAIFDISLYIFLPALMFFFELVFGSGYRNIVSYFRRFQIYYSIFGLIFLAVNRMSADKFQHAYFFVSVTFIGLIMIVQFILILGILLQQLLRKNIDSIILSTGLAIFAIVSIAELLKFYASSQTYNLSWWKWGLVAFVLSLIILLGRRFTYQHKLIVTYSRDLEIYNLELQRSEKMEIISQLAASVAHEVRNPLQVTRGMLQLLGERNTYSTREGEYYKLAIDELDRASTIITDFLTFAKPQLEQVIELNLAEEIKHVEGIIVPLANLQGGRIEINVPKTLMIIGNSSKLKQALINIIKNSIEALEGDGSVRVWAYQEKEHVVIHIADSGNGMDERILARLGEPYFSNKTKGTGLGLMVTFRIIEAMQGTIEFKSQKGIGTEATIRFPIASVEKTNAKVPM